MHRVCFCRPREHDEGVWDEESAARLGLKLRQLRNARGLSQEALAYQAGITKNQLQLIESGRASGSRGRTGPSNPRMATLAGIAGVLGLSVGEILVDAAV